MTSFVVPTPPGPSVATGSGASSARLPRAPSAGACTDAAWDALRAEFPAVPGYLNAATMGLPPLSVVSAMHAGIEEWQRGAACPVAYDGLVAQARAAYAAFVGAPESCTSIGSQTSVFAGLVAAALRPGDEVIICEGDFSSMVYPFLVAADRGVRVRQVPIACIADSIGPRTTLVALSLCQSADGALCDAEAITDAARRHGAATFVDLTQAAGWLPVDATAYDMTVCSAYKWMCQPRGTAYFTITPSWRDRLAPLNAGWYAGQDVWSSCYGPGMDLARDARQFDVSPAWLSWVGAVPALRVLGSVPTSVVRDHDVRLANALRARLGMPAQCRPVLSIPDPDGTAVKRLTAAGATVACRAGAVRIAFHLWNTDDDVELAAGALTDTRRTG